MITTFHIGNMMDSGKVTLATDERILKPNCVFDYATNMHLVDKIDMHLATVECIRKSIKWYKKLFFQ